MCPPHHLRGIIQTPLRVTSFAKAERRNHEAEIALTGFGCEDRIGTGPPRARREVIYVDLGSSVFRLAQKSSKGHWLWPHCILRSAMDLRALSACRGRFFIDNLLVRIHFIIVMIRWTGLAPWKFEFPFGLHAPPPRARFQLTLK